MVLSDKTATKKPIKIALDIIIAVLCATISVFAIVCYPKEGIHAWHDLADGMSCSPTVFAIIMSVFAIIYYRTMQIRVAKMASVCGIVCGILLAFCQTFGRNAEEFSGLIAGSIGPASVTATVLYVLGFFFVFYVAFLLLYIFTEKLCLSKSHSKHRYSYFTNNKRSLFAVAGMLISVWALYYIILFPGVTSIDSMVQILEGYGSIPLTDRNPVLITLFVTAVMKVGEFITGSMVGGIAFYTAVQLIITAFMVSSVIRFLAAHGIPVWARVLAVLFFGAHPVIGVYSVTVWKDIWLAMLVLLYAVYIIDATHDPQAFFGSKRKLCLFAVIMLGVLLSKGTGIIMIVFSLPLVYKYVKGCRIKLTGVIAVAFAVYFCFRSFIIPAIGITKGDIKEIMSTPLQQIARTVVYRGEELTDQEKSTINEILPYDSLDLLYKPEISDDVKRQLDQEQFKSDPWRYVSLWAQLGCKHPDVYAESFVLGSYGYWYPDTDYHLVVGSIYSDMTQIFVIPNGYELPSEELKTHDLSSIHIALRYKVILAINEGLRKVPIISSLLSIGFYFWLTLAFMLIAIAKKKYSLIPAYLVSVGVFVSNILSPVFAEARYAYPLILCTPILILFTVFEYRSKERT